MTKRGFRCLQCGHTWEIPHGGPRPHSCPRCKSADLHRAEEDRGCVRPGGRGRSRRGLGEPPRKSG